MNSTHFNAEEAHLIKGFTGTGKTYELIRSIKRALQKQVPSSQILVLASTPESAHILHARLREELAEGITLADGQHIYVKTPLVCTPRDFALQLLNTEKAYTYTGRRARLLTAFEQSFLMEDMKVTGLKIRRLREMLKFFYRSWTELREEDEEFFVTKEEREIHSLLKGHLNAMESIMEPELANIAVRYLDNCEAALVHERHEYVFVDDYQQLSRASQHLVNMVAWKSITVTVDTAATSEVFESYPYAGGITEFEEAYKHHSIRQLTEFWRGNAAFECVQSLLSAELLDAEAAHDATTPAAALSSETQIVLQDNPVEASIQAESDLKAADLVFHGKAQGISVQLTEVPSFTDEEAALVAAVQDNLERGTAAADVFVAGFEPMWVNRAARVLRVAGVPVNVVQGGPIRAADYRDLEKCQKARVATILALMADSGNAAAWRAWCGFGDYLGNSAEFDNLQPYIEQAGGLVAALDSLVAGTKEAATAAGCERIFDAYIEGRSILEKLENASCEDTLVILNERLALGGKAEALVYALVGEGFELIEPAVWWCYAEMRCNFPCFAEEGEAAEGVKVGSVAQLVGMNPQVVLVPGFMNGAIPYVDYFDSAITTIDQQRRMRAADHRSLYETFGKAVGEVHVFAFEHATLEEATRMKLQVGRMGLRDEHMVASVSPSQYLPLVVNK